MPSLPSIQRTSSPVPPAIGAHPSGPAGQRGFVNQSRPQLGSKPPTGPGSRPNPMPMGYPAHMAQAAGHLSHPSPQMGHAQLGSQMAHPMAPPLGHPGPNQMASPMANQMNALGHAGHLSGPNNLPGNPYSFGAQMRPAAPGRSNALVFVLIAVLIAAIGVLVYLVMTK